MRVTAYFAFAVVVVRVIQPEHRQAVVDQFRTRGINFDDVDRIVVRVDGGTGIEIRPAFAAACIELDKFTYSDSEVASRLSNFVNIKLDFSRSSKEVKRLTEKYEIPGLPVVIFLDSKGKPLKRLEGFVEPEKFLEILDTISKG
ncbi:hypothetical protein IH992_19255 [Candidatus Poribacteria bacterium]|nr:hypothetical protein [Candidatus Poribacteria bacterium]